MLLGKSLVQIVPLENLKARDLEVAETVMSAHMLLQEVQALVSSPMPAASWTRKERTSKSSAQRADFLDLEREAAQLVRLGPSAAFLELQLALSRTQEHL